MSFFGQVYYKLSWFIIEKWQVLAKDIGYDHLKRTFFTVIMIYT